MLKAKKHYRIDHIIDSLTNGQFKQAKAQTQYMCKTLPEKQAYKVGQIVGALMDKDGSSYNPNLAVRFLNLFND